MAEKAAEKPAEVSVCIKVWPEVKQKLDKLKQHPRETYSDVISRLVDGKVKK